MLTDCSSGTCAVLVRKVPQSATNEIVRAHFQVCGQVRRVSVLRGPGTRDRTDMAWVEFASPAEATRALALEGSTLLLQRITVQLKDSAEAVEAVRMLNAGQLAAIPPHVKRRHPSAGGRQASAGAARQQQALRVRQPHSFKYVRQGYTATAPPAKPESMAS